MLFYRGFRELNQLCSVRGRLSNQMDRLRHASLQVHVNRGLLNRRSLE